MRRAPVLALVATLALWISEVDAFGVGMGATRVTTTMGMGNSFGRLFRISTWGESHGGGVGVNLDGCPPKIPLSAQDIQVGASFVVFILTTLSRSRVYLVLSTATTALCGLLACGPRFYSSSMYQPRACSWFSCCCRVERSFLKH